MYMSYVTQGRHGLDAGILAEEEENPSHPRDQGTRLFRDGTVECKWSTTVGPTTLETL